MVHPSQFNLVVFDEVHRAVGDYAYTAIAQRFVGRDVRIMGMTATLPSEIDKATEIVDPPPRIQSGRAHRLKRRCQAVRTGHCHRLDYD